MSDVTQHGDPRWADQKVAVEHGRGSGGGGGGGGVGGVIFLILAVLGAIHYCSKKEDRHNRQQSPSSTTTSAPIERPSTGSATATGCTQRIGHACNNDFCGPPFRCDPDGVVRQIPEGGQCGSSTPGCTDCGFGGALRCGVYNWAVGECHCVD